MASEVDFDIDMGVVRKWCTPFQSFLSPCFLAELQQQKSRPQTEGASDEKPKNPKWVWELNWTQPGQAKKMELIETSWVYPTLWQLFIVTLCVYSIYSYINYN